MRQARVKRSIARFCLGSSGMTNARAQVHAFALPDLPDFLRAELTSKASGVSDAAAARKQQVADLVGASSSQGDVGWVTVVALAGIGLVFAEFLRRSVSSLVRSQRP